MKNKAFGINKKKYILIAFLILIFIGLRNILDREIYIASSLEADRTFSRQEYLGNGLGKIYKNRYGVIFFNKIYPVLMKFESSFFADLGDGIIYVPLIGSLIYFGYKKYNEK